MEDHMELAHCPSVPQLPSCVKPSPSGARVAWLCCQISVLTVSQPGEMLNVQFQSPVFFQENNFIIIKSNCEKLKRLILHFISPSQRCALKPNDQLHHWGILGHKSVMFPNHLGMGGMPRTHPTSFYILYTPKRKLSCPLSTVGLHEAGRYMGNIES